MGNQTDLVSAIGTWVAVFLALLALLGVLGPLLVWRASKTSRNRALAALEAGTAESGGYVTRGIPIGWGVRLFRRVRAPLLIHRPAVAGQIFRFDSTQKLPDEDSASWVKLGSVLDAYGMGYRTGDCMIVEDERAVLPVARIWILVVGMLGRFGHRRDHGKLPKPLPKKVKSIQARPGQHIPSGSQTPPHRRKDLPRPGWQTSQPGWAKRSSTYGHYPGQQSSRLSGVIGILEFNTDSGSTNKKPAGSVVLHTHEPIEIGDMSSEGLGIDGLFWLSVGCIPLKSQRVLCLENVEAISYDDYEETPQGPTLSPVPHVNFADDYDGGDSYSSGHEERIHYGHHEGPVLSPTSYLVQGSRRGHEGRTHGPRLFQFTAVEDRSRSLIDVATTVGAESDDVETLSLAEVEVPADDAMLLEQDAGVTYVPNEHPWVRLDSRVSSGVAYASGAWFLRRESAQLVARALIELPLCTQGYLIYKPRLSACRSMLVSASQILPRLLSRIMYGLDSLEIEDTCRETLSKQMMSMWRCTETFQYSRTFSHNLYALDQTLDTLTGGNELVRVAVQALVLTNTEFREIVGQSIRRIEECAGLIIKLDLVTSTINIPTVFGIVQKFPIEISVLLDEPLSVQGQGHFDIGYTELLMLVLKASLRSAFLETSLDSLPLFKKVMSMNDVIHVL